MFIIIPEFVYSLPENMLENIREKVLQTGQLAGTRERNKGRKIVFCTGCYDILQSGHAVFFSQCRQFGDVLVVGVGRDKVISKLKGPGRPVNPENNRLYLVAAMQDVDYAVLNDKSIYGDKIDFKNILEKLRPDVFVVNNDDSGIDEKRSLCSAIGIHLELVKRIVPPELEPTSTTRIIDKINFKYRAPLRMDFAGGWTDVPFIMGNKKGYVSNATISPLIEYKNGQFNFSGYPRGSGLSTSTAAKLLEMISSKTYNSDSKGLSQIGEDLFNLENTELNWAIGRQDQYSIVYGGFNCFEFGRDYAKRMDINVPAEVLDAFKKNLLLIHTGVSRNAQSAVEQVYQNHRTASGQNALDKLARLGLEFAMTLEKKDFIGCAMIMEENFKAQIQLATASSNEYLDHMYDFAKNHGAKGGKIAGAGGGGAFIFYCEDPGYLKNTMKEEFVDCFEIDFDFHFKDIKSLNKI
ncbi:MAG: adenylyltransferase/cytidyltransferase family protein [Bacteroidales bacterium]|nr:adenylyltransferase/cytidyltransferase family protein [Bacteroidales bacterium]